MRKTLFPSRAPARPRRPTGSPARRHVRAHPPLRRQHLSQSRPMLVARRLRRAHSAARLLAGARQRAKGRLANGNPMGRWNERVFAFRDFETGNGRRASRVVRIVTLQHPNGFRVARAQIAAETGVRVPLLPLTGVSHSTVTSATVGGKCTCTRASSFTRSGGFGTTFSQRMSTCRLPLVGLLAVLVALCGAQMLEKRVYSPIKEDLPYIACESCQKAVKSVHRKINELRKESKAKVQLQRKPSAYPTNCLSVIRGQHTGNSRESVQSPYRTRRLDTSIRRIPIEGKSETRRHGRSIEMPTRMPNDCARVRRRRRRRRHRFGRDALSR